MKKSGTLVVILLCIVVNKTYSQTSATRMMGNYFKAKEEGKNLRYYQSWHLGVSVPLENTYTFSWDYWNRAEDGTYLGKSNVTRTFKNKALVLNAAVYFPMFEITETSALAFNLGVMGYGLVGDIDEIRIGHTTYQNQFVSMQMGMPLTFDFKYGGEATNDKAEKFSFTLGAGMCPIMYISTFGEFSNTRGSIRPYVHGEIGFFAGIEWKFKVDYLAKSTEVYRVDYRDFETLPEGSLISVKGQPMLSVGIALMPFSYDWESSRW